VKARALAFALAALAAFALANPGVAAAQGDASAGASAPTAPDAPPLTGVGASSGGGGAGESGGTESGAGTPEAQADPLVSNGLGSPSCRGALAGELSATSKRNCETSGFVAAPAPTGNYGFDVHIDTGLLGLGSGAMDSAVQGLVVTPVWMALVWATHALVVMLEWCFTLDLLDSSATIGLGSALRQMQASFTEPWLAIVLACAAALAAYHGLVRRRVADTLGETLAMGAMMVAGLALIADPTGTVGALGQWADQASLGTLATAAQGTPAGPQRALGSSLATLFAAAIEAPWCYLEFGDVSWCREPSRLDPRLRAAALKIAAQDAAALACRPEATQTLPCVPAGSAQARALAQSAALLRDARSNGAIFLALPANGAERNSINESGSLLHALCQSSEASNCHGPTAAQAEFRTRSGTLARLSGLVLIGAGLAGMLALLGFLAVRLLTAAVFSLLYLLFAPAIVLVPAFGEHGRALFRKWGAQLFGAVVSKLVFSFLLGVVLALLGILYKLTALGWWTQWLLTSAFWWGAFKRRHQILTATTAGPHAQHVQRRSLARRVSEVLETPRRGLAAVREAKDRFTKQAPDVERQRRAQASQTLARAGAGEQLARSLQAEHRQARTRAASAPQVRHQLAAKHAQLTRLQRERAEALARGDTRRAAQLRVRADRVSGEIDDQRQALDGAQQSVREGEAAQRRTGLTHTPERRDAQERLLAAQAALPARGRANAAGARRDYAALAGLAGYGREEYAQLDPRRQRAARAEIDRELAFRQELGRAADAFADPLDTLRLRRGERRKTSRELDGTVRRRMRERGHTLPASRQPSTPIDQWRAAGRNESSVLDDAREVAARRKRQLGRDRP